jgi:anti-sigma regulatory factor (Ser/Thr protein kinase)
MSGSSDELQLPTDPSAGRLARAFVLSLLGAWGLDELCDTVALLTSEVVTNAVLHAASPLAVRVTRLDDGVRVAITDGSLSQPARRRHSQEATTGRGLQLLDDLSDDWGSEATASGKTVWFTASTASDPWAPYANRTWALEAGL